MYYVSLRLTTFIKAFYDDDDQGCSPKKWGTPETRLRQRLLNNLGLHIRTLKHVIENCHSGSLVLSSVSVSVADRY